MRELTLSKEQERAVLSGSSAIVVVAGAGSGKTEVLARRVERLLAESKSENFKVLAVTYTVKAADELKDRLKGQLRELWRRVDTDTLHGFALSLLRKYGTRVGLPAEPEILSRDEDRVDLLNRWLGETGIHWPDAPPETFRNLDLARARLKTAPLLEEWRLALEEQGALDYPAMLEKASELLEGPWVGSHLKRLYKHIAVDEAQNLSPAQYEFLKALVGDPRDEHLNAILIGDQRQSVVEFAGADRTLIDRFRTEYGAEWIELHTNYRSAGTIARVGQRIAQALGHPVEGLTEYPASGTVRVQQFPTEREEGKQVAEWIMDLLANGLPQHAVAPGESTLIKPSDVAVLGRAAAHLREVGRALEIEGVEYAVASSPDDWVSSPAAKAVTEIVAFRASPEHRSVKRRLEAIAGCDSYEWTELGELFRGSSVEGLKKLANVPLGGPEVLIYGLRELELEDPDWEGDLQQIEEAWTSFQGETARTARTFANFRHHLARCQRGESLKEGVRLLTVQKAQGKEFRAVCVVACNEGQIPDFRAKAPSEREAELRIFYVAVTRPSRALLLTRAEERSTRYGSINTRPSNFLSYVD